MRWQNQFRALLCNVGRRFGQKVITNSNCRSVQAQSFHAIVSIESQAIKLPFKEPARPLHQYLQQLRISSSRTLLADSTSDATPISSPLIPAIGPPSGKAESQAVVSKPDKVQAVLKGVKQSPKKVNLVATLVRGMRVEDALMQLQVTVKRASKTVYQVIHSARANATHNHGMDPEKLLVAEAFVGKGYFKKRLAYHAKCRNGIIMKPECRLTVVVREMTPEEEAEIARLRVRNFRKLSKRERRLVPHKLIESNPVWGQKNKRSGRAMESMA